MYLIHEDVFEDRIKYKDSVITSNFKRILTMNNKFRMKIIRNGINQILKDFKATRNKTRDISLSSS